MEASLGSCILRWRALRAFSMAWLLMTFGFIALSFPQRAFPFGMVGSILGVSIGGLAILRGRWKWSVISLLDAGLLFFTLLLTETASKTVGQNLPVTLLQFVMLLFTVELLTIVSTQHVLFSKETRTAQSSVSIPVMQKSNQQTFRQLSRLVLLFGTCYLLSVGVLYAGAFITTIAPFLADVSLYLVIVSISLALLIILRED